MRRKLLYIIALVVCCEAIRVPVDKTEDKTKPSDEATQPQDPPTYYKSDESQVDSYLVPPDPHKPDDEESSDVSAPATFLQPPVADKQTDYFASNQSPEQTDWYPVAQAPRGQSTVQLLSPAKQQHAIPIFMANEPSESSFLSEQRRIQIPSRELQPPSANAPNEYKIAIPSKELELPLEESNPRFDMQIPIEFQLPNSKIPNYEQVGTRNVPLNYRIKPVDPTLALHLMPPTLLTKYKNPTKLYPKKYAGGFKPIPIPIAQFAELSPSLPEAKPLKVFNPVSVNENLTPSEEKHIYLFEQAQQKRKLRGEIAQDQQTPAEEGTYGETAPEQEALESQYRQPLRNAYPAPLRQAPPEAPASDQAVAPPPGDRTEFRMHGMKGPHSYQFGFDTGKGKNRQFRFEERDNDGHVKGHYGYVDKRGKLRVVNYNADQNGFHADAPVDKE